MKWPQLIKIKAQFLTQYLIKQLSLGGGKVGGGRKLLEATQQLCVRARLRTVSSAGRVGMRAAAEALSTGVHSPIAAHRPSPVYSSKSGLCVRRGSCRSQLQPDQASLNLSHMEG